MHVRPLAALLALAVTALAHTARADRTPVPQPHEIRADLDLAVADSANSAVVGLQYTWTPTALDRFDPVAPPLRRFVRHPNALWARLAHDGSILDTRSGVHAGGALHLFDGRLYGLAEIGAELDTVIYDTREDGYVAMPAQVEVGLRPAGMVSLGAFARVRSILDSTSDSLIVEPVTRSGEESELGGTATVLTPGDRLFLTLALARTSTAWTFTGFHAGEIDVSGLSAVLALNILATRSTSWLLRAQARREDWENDREGDSGADFVGSKTNRLVWTASADMAMIYWFQGRLGFRVAFGGGLAEAPPIYYHGQGPGRFPGFGELGLGLVSRF